ncbi:hypothetical protein NDU88_001004 [Pleurodeles waltl]|uniref:Uncharacterized protein n=1 Tax=Pleurodeles waltl TaxID=8319 RepID=A0AAV7L876_PLEWA|nr:hypothetical protein NDU88_001004 [Pleurodeles waltl]
MERPRLLSSVTGLGRADSDGERALALTNALASGVHHVKLLAMRRMHLLMDERAHAELVLFSYHKRSFRKDSEKKIVNCDFYSARKIHLNNSEQEEAFPVKIDMENCG